MSYVRTQRNVEHFGRGNSLVTYDLFHTHTRVCSSSRYLIYSIETKNKIVISFKENEEKKSWNLSPPEATHEKKKWLRGDVPE